jgi:hypothetical protein
MPKGLISLLLLPILALVIIFVALKVFDKTIFETDVETTQKTAIEIVEESTLGIVGSNVTVSGQIISKDPNLTAGDKDGILQLKTLTAKTIKIIVPSSERLCSTKGAIENFNLANVGDNVEVFGRVTQKNEITLCDSDKYYLKIP